MNNRKSSENLEKNNSFKVYEKNINPSQMRSN